MIIAPHLVRHHRRRRGVGTYVGLGLAVAGLVALGVVGWRVYDGLARLDGMADVEPPAVGAYESRMYNYRFQYPSAAWKPDRPTQLDLRCGLALRRTDPNAWLAILTADYKTRNPTESEMVDEGVRRLRAYFVDNFQWEPRPEGELAGKSAWRFDFVGVRAGVEMSGAAYLLGHQGIGYWFLTWAPSENKEVLADTWDEVRQGFTLGKEREGWTGKPAKQLDLAGEKAPYTLRCSETVWERQDRPSAYDPDADAALLGHDQAQPKDTDKNATAIVLVLPGQEDLKAAVRAARAHVLAQEKKLYPDCTLENADGKPAADDRPPDRVGDHEGRILRLQLKVPDAAEHFLYLAVVPGAEQVVVIQCECDLRRRVYWEVNFTQLVREFRLPAR